MTPVSPPAAPVPTVRGPLTTLALSMLLPALGTSVANVGLPTFAKAFDAPFQDVQWIVLAYLLTITTLIVTIGRLGDIIGRRRLLRAGMALFALASALCAMAPSLWLLVAARALQGLGASVMMALTMAFVGETVPKSRTGSAMGLLGTTSAIGTMVGPAVGGILIARFGWPSMFLAIVPPAVVAWLMAGAFLPPDRPAAKRPGFDHRGTLLLALTLGCYALAMTLGRGHFGPSNIALLLGAAAGAAVFVYAELKAPTPLIRLGMLRAPALSSGLATSALVSTVMMATLVVGPFYLARGLGLDTGMTGLVMAAGPLMAAFCGVPSGRAVDRFGAQRMGSLGLCGAAAACVALALLPASLGIAGYAAPLMVLTASYALFQAANNTAVMTDIAAEQRGLVSAMLNLSRNLGLVTGASVMGALFAWSAAAGELANAQPADMARGMHTTFAVAAALVIAALALTLASRAFSQSPSGDLA